MTNSTTFNKNSPEILVVDDTIESLKMLATSLSGEGYRVRPANSGQLAIDSISEKAPDLILLDVKMPEMDGFEVCRRLKMADVSRHIPVIFISALDQALDKVKAFEAGAVDYITKPFQIEEVLVRIKTQLTLQKMQMALEKSHHELEERVSQRTTELKVANQKLTSSQEKFRSLYDKAPLGYQSLDREGNFLEVNETWLQLLGYTLKDVIGKNFSEFLHPDWKDHFKENFPRFKAIGEILGVEFEMVKKNGDLIMVSFHGKISRDDSGDFKQTHCIFRDITEQQRFLNEKQFLETRLRQAQKMESIGTLAGGIAHDFNNILTSIIGYTQLSMGLIEIDSAIKDYLQEIYAAGQRAKDLVWQILAFARQSNEEILPIRVDIIATEVLKFIRSSIPTTINIEQDIQSKSLILGNSTQVYQVLMNLCTNAAHAMELNGGVLSIGLQDIIIDDNSKMARLGMTVGNYIQLTISDTGDGIAPEIIDSIFEPYFTTKSPKEGTGLGLAVVHGIIESYGGRITVDSHEGKGTTFSIYLPITEKQFISQAHEAEKLPKGTEHILFVDDEVTIANVGRLILENLGYTVTVCNHSLEALALFRSNCDDYDLIISDMTMPNMTGDQLAVEVMKIRSNIPVILCTGYNKKISEEAARKIGVKVFALKPIDLSDLAKTVRKVIDEAKTKSS